MLGGYQIIDLSGMNIALSGDAVSITDQKILRQLLALRDYIEENYNFTKPLNKKLKPVMIRLRDKESGEKIEGALWGNLSIVDDNLSFNIDAIVTASPLKVLQINVVFEKKQDDDGNDYYDIKSAKYEYKGGEDVVTVTNIKNISSAIINKLDCGDIVLKKDSSGLHAYIVSFRSATGICLTYTDASVIETQSYDKVGQNWVYNSEDKSGNLIEDVKPIYWHGLEILNSGASNLTYFTCHILNNSPTPITTWAQIAEIMRSTSARFTLEAHGKIDISGTSRDLLSIFKRANETKINIVYMGDTKWTSIDEFDFSSVIGYIYDGVNKIN